MRQKNIPKKKVKQSEVPGEGLFLDISSIKYTTLSGARFWVLIMDDCSDFLTIFFLQIWLKEKGVMIFKKIENVYDLKIMRVRCNNAGGNVSLEKNV